LGRGFEPHLATAFVFVEWRSWKKPLPREFEDATGSGSLTVRAHQQLRHLRPFGRREDVEKPHD
jgi:hypothetical protein